MLERNKTRQIRVGNVVMGGDSPITIQTMTNTNTADTLATIEQIEDIYKAGGELVRVAVPDEDAVKGLREITKASPVPVIADIHFHHELALKAIDQGVAKVRINPGNLGGKEKLLQVAEKAGENGVALRIGVNAASLEKDILQGYQGDSPSALVKSAVRHVHYLEKFGFYNMVISLKASDAPATFQAYSLLAREVDYPLHIGVTEAGPYYRGTVKSAVGIGSLLMAGLGDTVRVSLTASPVEEVKTARLILQAAGARIFGPELISCPTCGRCEIDVPNLAAEVEDLIASKEHPWKIAVMGCVVNGPGEARNSHLGVTGTPRQGIIFKYGEIIRRVPRESLLEALQEELSNLESAESGI